MLVDNHMLFTTGLLLFAESKKLGPNGLNWLKIHCVNLTGLKKRETLTDRLQYADQMLDDILDSASEPLTGRRWWTQSEEPWQTLACCMEIANALRHPDGPAEYATHYPVHQDGSCNGLQHYATLGRDSAGAFQVNLRISDKPQDVYEGVAQLIETKRQREAMAGSKLAAQLKNVVQRKVVKQTVMTIVYGVTRYGAKNQISKQLKELPNFPKDLVPTASRYLMHKTFDSLSQIFAGARNIQDWLAEIASLISRDCQKPVEWRTPLNFPVVQPYYKSGAVVASVFGDYEAAADANVMSRRGIYGKTASSKPDSRKQRSGFPPNFIHSLDSSHMMLTSLFCQQAGICFASVHDCFWTHPASVEEMGRILRQQFVALHSLPVLDNLSKDLLERYVNNAQCAIFDKKPNLKTYLRFRLSDVPKKGNFDIHEILQSVYFFS